MFPTLPPFALDTSSLRRALRKFGENDSQNITLIGDPCNDENTLLSQLRVAFLRFHNTLVRQVKTASDPTHPAEIFAEAPWLTRWHDQWITLHEFLPETVGQTVVDNIFTKGRKFYSFAVAALPAHAEEDLISAPAPLQWPVKAGPTASSDFRLQYCASRSNSAPMPNCARCC